MARPRRSSTLAAPFSIYLSAEASDRLRAKAKEAGVSPGAYVERLLVRRDARPDAPHAQTYTSYLGNHCSVCKAKKGSDAWKQPCPS